MISVWKIRRTDPSDVTKFASDEFIRLITQMDPTCTVLEAEAEDQDVLCIGLDAPIELPEVDDPQYDDGIAIHVSECCGVISGVNSRSVVFAVYRFFTEAGCEFLRPGREGEFIPVKASGDIKVKVTETPAYRHRGVCIEGSNTFEDVGCMIDYLPKVGMNTYFTQFFRPYDFFDRRYSHKNWGVNPLFTPTPISTETVDGFVKDYSAMMQTRGLIHQCVGHGWTAKCLGVDANGWYSMANDNLSPERRRLIALVNGERKLALAPSMPNAPGEGVPLYTNLCYSNPEARRLFVDAIEDYCTSHPEADYVHIWLADQPNNQCECEECRKLRPADMYVELLNEADERLTKIGCKAKLVFLLYLDLLWPPKKAKFKNPDRFTLMFAPISRTYSSCYETEASGKIADFKLNHIELPRTIGDTLAYLRGWQNIFKGDSFVYDYHFIWDHNFDFGDCSLSHVLVDDIANLKAIGLDGMIACAITRCTMPTGLGLNLLGKGLWKGNLDFKKSEKEYFEAAFGVDAELAQEYLETLSRLCTPEYVRLERPRLDPKAAEAFAQIPAVIEQFRPVMQRNLRLPNFAQARSWFYLSQSAPLYELLAKMLYAKATGNDEGALCLWKEVKNAAYLLELSAPTAFEAHQFNVSFERLFDGSFM